MGKFIPINLLSSQITTSQKWLEAFYAERIKQKAAFWWESDIRANELTVEKIRLMKKAGCVGMFMGVESFDQKILDRLNKNLTVKQIINAIHMLKKEGMLFNIPIMLNIGETEEEINKYIHFIRKYKPPRVSFNILMVYPHTVEGERLEKLGSYDLIFGGTDPLKTYPGVEKSLEYKKKLDSMKWEITKQRLLWIMMTPKVWPVYIKSKLRKINIR